MLRVCIAFFGVTLSTSAYLALTPYLERTTGVSMFGFSTCDNMLLPFTIIPFIYIMSFFRPCWQLIEPYHTPLPFMSLLKQTWMGTTWEAGLALVVFRGLLLGREFLYFYLVTNFNLSVVFFLMTLLRVIMMWLCSLFVCYFFPNFIALSPAERERTFSILNIVVKIIGSSFIVGSLVSLHRHR